MLTTTRRLQRPAIYVAVLLWISYLFVIEGIIIGIVAAYISLIIASIADTES